MLSPGESTSQRAALEGTLQRRVHTAIDLFIADALRLYEDSTRILIASSFNPLDLTLSWTATVVDTFTDTLSSVWSASAGPFADYLTRLEQRLSNNPLPASLANFIMEVGTGRDLKALLGLVDPRLDEPSPSPYNWAANIDRIIRTEATAAHNFAALDALAQSGATHKRWIAYHDEVTRPTHSEADGQTQPLALPFLVGNQALMVPGDPLGRAGETANCRCVIAAARG